MIPKPRTWLRLSGGFWVALGCALVLALAAACKDVTVPRIVPPEDDTTTQDTTQKQGWLLVPGPVEATLT